MHLIAEPSQQAALLWVSSRLAPWLSGACSLRLTSPPCALVISVLMRRPDSLQMSTRWTATQRLSLPGILPAPGHGCSSPNSACWCRQGQLGQQAAQQLSSCQGGLLPAPAVPQAPQRHSPQPGPAPRGIPPASPARTFQPAGSSSRPGASKLCRWLSPGVTAQPPGVRSRGTAPACCPSLCCAQLRAAWQSPRAQLAASASASSPRQLPGLAV